MGILDWFKKRPGKFDPDRVSEEMVDWGVEKAIALTNPQLKLLPASSRRLAPAVETTIKFLRGQASTLPAVHTLSSRSWSDDPVLRAFFVAPSDIEGVLGASDNLRTLFGKYPELDEAYAVLGMSLKVQPVFGMALQGNVVQRDVAQTSASFSDHRTRLCDRDELRLRRVVGVAVFEYLLAQALFEIGQERVERQDLQTSRSLIRTRLRLLQQHGPGLGSIFGEVPAAQSEQARLAAELLENERQLEELGGNSVLEAELECLGDVLDNPQRYLHFEPGHLRLNRMNLVLDEGVPDAVADVRFSVIELKGHLPMRRAFVLARVPRAELPPPKKVNFDDASRYL